MNLFLTRIPFVPIWPEKVDLDGIHVPLKSLPLDARTRRRVMRGLYEPSERDLISQFIQPGDQILELGASVGIVSCFLTRQSSPNGRLVSVEADARLEQPFRRQLQANQMSATWIHALCCPLWQNEVPSAIASQTFAASSKTLSGRAVTSHSAQASVPWLTPLAIARQTNLVPTAWIVDIEGSEAVWAELPPQIPPSIRIVIAEFHPRLTGARIAGQAAQAILNEGFSIAGLHESVVAFQRKLAP